MTVRVPGPNGEVHSQTIRVSVDDDEPDFATCTFHGEVQGAISGTFEGTATVSFDSEGRAAQVTDLELETTGFDLNVGLQPAHRMGAPVMGSVLSVAGRGQDADEGAFEIFGQQDDYGDYVSVDIRESRVIPWRRMPASLRTRPPRCSAGGPRPWRPRAMRTVRNMRRRWATS